MAENFYRQGSEGLQQAKEIGGFHLVQKLGRTPENLVYLAHTDHGSPVVIKVAQSPEQAVYRKRLKEVALQNQGASLHPHVVKVVEWGQDEDGLVHSDGLNLTGGNFAYSVTPYFPTRTMGNWRRSIADWERNDIVKDALRNGLLFTTFSAVDTIGLEGGIVHRDLKADNVLRRNGQGYVTDFGTAITVGEAEHTDIVTATPSLVAPEQLNPDTYSYGHETDVWYGAELILYLLDGQHLTRATFDNPDPARKILTQDSLEQYLDTRLVHLPIGYQDVIRSGLQFNPSERPSTLMDLYLNLEEAAKHPNLPTVIYRAGLPR